MFKEGLRSKGLGNLFIIGAILTVMLSVSCGGPTSSGGPANIAGTYTLTLTASSVCAQLPINNQYLRRNYTAIINQTDDEVTINFPGYYVDGAASGRVTGNSVYLDFNIEEDVGHSVYDLYIRGDGTGTMSRETISGRLDGTFYRRNVTCLATDHQFSFTRSGDPTIPNGPANIAGTYMLHVIPSTVCGALVGRSFGYCVTLIQNGSEVDGINVENPNRPDSSFSSDDVTGEVHGNTVQFHFGIMEVLPVEPFRLGFNFYKVRGLGTGNVTNTNISGYLNGTFEMYLPDYNFEHECRATDHQFSFIADHWRCRD